MYQGNYFNRIDEKSTVKYREQGYTYPVKLKTKKSRSDEYQFGECIINAQCLIPQQSSIHAYMQTVEEICHHGRTTKPSWVKDQNLGSDFHWGLISMSNLNYFEDFTHIAFDFTADFLREGSINDKVYRFEPSLVDIVGKNDCDFRVLHKPHDLSLKPKTQKEIDWQNTEDFVTKCMAMSNIEHGYKNQQYTDLKNFGTLPHQFVWLMGYILGKKVTEYGIDKNVPTIVLCRKNKNVSLQTGKRCFEENSQSFCSSMTAAPMRDPLTMFNNNQLASYLADGRYADFGPRETEKFIDIYTQYRDSYNTSFYKNDKKKVFPVKSSLTKRG